MAEGRQVPLLELRGISKKFGGVAALKGVSFALAASEVHAIVGENGAGKSTLIKTITGAHQPDTGEIVLGGNVIHDNSPGVSRALGIAVIYQQPSLFPDLTVAENIALRLEQGGPFRWIRWGRRYVQATELLARVQADISPGALVRDLSMPQQQLVEIAAALGAEARVLILDEPTASLSERETVSLLAVIRQLRTQGLGIIYISHRLEELPLIADRVTVLRDGNCIGTRSMAEVDRAELIRLMVGRELSAVFPKITVPIGDVVLELRESGCQASGVGSINLTVRTGEIVGLAGLVGAGRTELARSIFGLTPFDEGSLWLEGTPVVIDSPATAVRQGIAYVPEDRRRHGVILDMPVSANITLAILKQIAGFGLIHFTAERELADSYVQKFSIKTPSVWSAVGNLSGGNQQKVALARWLVTKPKVIILDEPTQGVDVGAKSEIHKLMGELAAQGLAILMISSELAEVLGMADRIAVMHAGRIVGELPRESATQANVLEMALGNDIDNALQFAPRATPEG